MATSRQATSRSGPRPSPSANDGTRWVSLCCGLAATECRAMTGRFPPVARMGGKRAYADGVLDILGTWPKRWLFIDADIAVVEFWQTAFAGLLPAVADVIRNAPADGEELWRLWATEPVPVDLAERVARWIVLQKGNFSARPITWTGGGWYNTAGGWSFKRVAGGRPDNSPAISVASTSRRLDAVDGWSGVAGFASLSPIAREKGFHDRIVREDLADKAGRLQPMGEALYLDLATSSPIVRPGDLVTIDPPYQGTTGYGCGLSRERVVELAQEVPRARRPRLGPRGRAGDRRWAVALPGASPDASRRTEDVEPAEAGGDHDQLRTGHGARRSCERPGGGAPRDGADHRASFLGDVLSITAPVPPEPQPDASPVLPRPALRRPRRRR